MKRTLFCICFVVICVVFCSCNKSELSKTEASDFETTVTTESTTEPNDVWYITEAPVTDVPTTDPAQTEATTTVTESNDWFLVEHVDDFGDSIGEYSVCQSVYGTYTDILNKTYDIQVHFGCLEDSSVFIFFSDSDGVVNLYSFYDYTMKIKIGDKKYDCEYTLADDYLFVMYYSEGYDEILKALKSGEDIQFVIKQGTDQVYTYKFTIDGYGFSDTLEQIPNQ